MMTVFLILAGTLTSGFFLYVLVKFHGESKRLNAIKKRLRERSFEIEANPEREELEKKAAGGQTRIQFGSVCADGPARPFRPALRGAAAAEDPTEALDRREAWFSVTLSVCGLAALFAGIEIFNLLMMWSH